MMSYLYILLIIITFLIIIATLFFILLILLSIPSIIRSYRLSRLAKYFNLSFDRKSSFIRFNWHYERNFIEGEINGHVCKIYDSYRRVLISNKGYWFAWLTETTGRTTIVSINSDRKIVRSFLSGLASIRKIKQILKELQECKAINHYDIRH